MTVVESSINGVTVLAPLGGRPAVRKLFEVTRLDQGLMGVYDTVEGAVEALSGIESREDRP